MRKRRKAVDYGGELGAELANLGWVCGRQGRRWLRGIRRGDAEGFVDSFEKDGHVDGFVEVGDRTGFEGSVAISDGGTGGEDDDGDGARVHEHR